MEIDPLTGLPKDLGTFEDISKDNQIITASIEKKKFGKKYTVIEGFDEKSVNLKDISKSLKSRFACGGTSKDGKVELQGDYIGNIQTALIDLGFKAENIRLK